MNQGDVGEFDVCDECSSLRFKPSNSPELVIRYFPKVTGIEFLSQFCGIFGIWFGFSFFALHGWYLVLKRRLRKLIDKRKGMQRTETAIPLNDQRSSHQSIR